MDPPLNKCVTDAHFAKRTKEVDSSDLLASPINLSEKLPLIGTGSIYQLNRQQLVP